MEASSSPNRPRRPRTDHAGSDAIWNISPGTRARAQEADANMARDEWRYTAPNGIHSDLPAAESRYFLE